MINRKLYCYEDAASLCGVSSKSIQRAVAKRELKAVQAPGTTSAKGLRISEREIDRYILAAESAGPTMRQWREGRNQNEERRQEETA